jgi:hypothetical protein
MFSHSSFQTAGANPGPRTVSLDLPGLFKHPLRLVEPFLKENRQTNTALLQILETKYLNRDHVVPSADGGLWDEQQLAQFDAMKDNERAQLGEEFWHLVEGLSDKWDVLDATSQEFKTVRDKWIAHYEVRYDPTKEEVRGFDVPTIFEFYKKLNTRSDSLRKP